MEATEAKYTKSVVNMHKYVKDGDRKKRLTSRIRGVNILKSV